MQRYDEFYYRPGRNYPPARRRPTRRWYSARPEQPFQPRRYGSSRRGFPDHYAEEFSYFDDFGEYRPMGSVAENQERMGMRDFSERYGRYSGGSPYSYEYSERTIYHQPRFTGAIGFTRPLGWESRERERRSRAPMPRERWYGR